MARNRYTRTSKSSRRPHQGQGRNRNFRNWVAFAALALSSFYCEQRYLAESAIGSYDKEMRQPAKPIAFIVYPEMQALDLVGPMDVFTQANQRFGSVYDIHILGNAPRLTISGGLVIAPEPLSSLAIDTFIIPGAGAVGLGQAMADMALMSWIADTAGRAERVATICTGAFLLMPTGLLSGRRVATHWAGIDHLSLIAPDIIPERDAMYVEDGRFWSSAGISAGIDLALALVRRDLGAECARAVARDLVVTLARPIQQSAYAEPYMPNDKLSEPIDGLFNYVMRNLDRVMSTDTLAASMGLSSRTFHRRCLARYGVTPARFVQNARLDAARSLLINRNLRLKQIAEQTGFADESSLSSAFRKKFGVSTKNYRNGFSVME